MDKKHAPKQLRKLHKITPQEQTEIKIAGELNVKFRLLNLLPIVEIELLGYT